MTNENDFTKARTGRVDTPAQEHIDILDARIAELSDRLDRLKRERQRMLMQKRSDLLLALEEERRLNRLKRST